ncbi:MAG: NUDIX hydrolase [Candidatus Saccharimonadaceae bacterium]
MRTTFPVSAKAAIYDVSCERVLVIHMDDIVSYGLPGGHVDEGEALDDAMRRELLEECGIVPDELAHADFFIHSEGKIVLAYVGRVYDDTLFSRQDNLEGIPKWLTRQEFIATNIEQYYRDFVIKNWPDMGSSS